MMDRLESILMLTLHIILPKQTNFKIIRLFENLAFVIMSSRENLRLIARASFIYKLLSSNLLFMNMGLSHERLSRLSPKQISLFTAGHYAGPFVAVRLF